MDREVRGALRREARDAIGARIQVDARRTAAAFRIDHFEHDVRGQLVRSGSKRAGYVEQVDPQGVSDAGRLRGPAVGQQPGEPVVERTALHRDTGHEIGIRKEAPERVIGLIAQCDQILDLHNGPRLPLFPLRFGSVAHVPVGLPSGSPVDQDPTLPLRFPGKVDQSQVQPEGERPPANLADATDPVLLMEIPHEIPRALVDRQEVDTARGRPDEPRARHIERPGTCRDRGPVAKPAVDRRFRGVEHRDLLAALPGGVVLGGHHGPEDAAPPVRGTHGDGRHGRSRQPCPAGHRQLTRPGPEGTDSRPVEGSPDTVEIPVRNDLRGDQRRVGAIEERGRDAFEPRRQVILADAAKLV